MSFSGFSNNYKEFIEDYADKNTQGNNSWDERAGNVIRKILEINYSR